MENILNELFRTQSQVTSEGTIYLSNAGSRRGGIRGTYLKDFGIIFMIPGASVFPNSLRVNGQNGFMFFYSTDDNSDNSSREIDEDAIKNRMSEFLTDYGSTIGQLQDDENIMVIFGSGEDTRRSMLVGYVDANGNSSFQRETDDALPIISASVTMKDLNDYRRGSLNADQIQQRIRFANSEDKEYMDLKVMSNIFETGLKENSEDAYRMSGGISHIMLDNFGAIFSFDVRFGSSIDFVYGRLASTLRGTRVMQERRARLPQGSEAMSEEMKSLQEQADELEAKMLEAYDDLKSNIAEYLVDYGRTLSSVDSDQFILTSVNVSSGGAEGIPERVDIQIKKSVLEQLDRGRISRDDAIKAVSITEY